MGTLVEIPPQPELIPHSESASERSWLRALDMRLTSAAARLRIQKKKKAEGKKQLKSEEQSVPAVAEKKEKKETPLPAIPSGSQTLPNNKPPTTTSSNPPTKTVAKTVPDKRWSLSDLLRCLGTYVQRHCTHLSTIPSASEVAVWVRSADRALQLNGWTVNCFLLESHVVFTYMLLCRAFQQFSVSSIADAKELVLMCLYISYTYNANEISYPLRPFLVKQDRVAFWDKCTTLSLSASAPMLRINRDRGYYEYYLAKLRAVSTLEY